MSLELRPLGSEAVPAEDAALDAGPDIHDEASVLAGVFRYPRLMLVRGEGSYVWDVEGRRYLDFTAGLAVAALGHGRRDLAQVLADQFGTLGHCSNLYGNLPALALARRLASSSFAARVWFANSGAEAIEAAIKFARLFGRRAGGPSKHALVAFRGGFHGRTLGALSVTHHPEYRAPFAPLVPGVRFAAFNDLDSARRVMNDAVCAVLVEPVQGEGGVVPATPDFLHGLRALCDEHQALLVFDEVQCGMGRLGALFAYQAYGVVPDMITLAKPLAAGLPLGATLLNARVAAVLEPGQHGSTFAGGPAACAVGVRVFDEVSEPSFLAHVREMGDRLSAGLALLSGRSALFAGARGAGLMQALVLERRHRPLLPDLVRLCRERGLLVTRAGDDALRLLPPLNCGAAEVDEALAILAAVADQVRPPARRRRTKAANTLNSEASLVGAGGKS